MTEEVCVFLESKKLKAILWHYDGHSMFLYIIDMLSVPRKGKVSFYISCSSFQGNKMQKIEAPEVPSP